RSAAMAKDLYDSLRVMGDNLGGLGKALSSALKKYNATVGGYESRVLSRARKFADYELPGVEADIETLSPLEETPRLLRGADDPETKTQDDAA
ncbi:MAG: DNA recombination protein RmuC, partial [Pseudomonadota bacterium]